MRGAWRAGLLIALALAVFPAGGQEKKKGPKKDGNTAYTDPEKAGPDFRVQGEYVGEVKGMKVGAQVIARGDGKFAVVVLPGGLPGAGWDGKRKLPATARREGDKTVLMGEGVGGSIVAEKMTLTRDEGSLTLGHRVRRSPTLGMKPPEGAVVLFDGKSLEGWTEGRGKGAGKEPAKWKVLPDAVMQVQAGRGDVQSKKTLRDFRLHLEFRLPFMPYARGQGRSNSGVYLQKRYELQVLDSFGLKGENNECGGFYQQAAPRVNMCYPPLAWQTYDIDFTAARFEGGKRVKNAVVTVRHNGVVIHEGLELKGPTPGGEPETDAPGPLLLQDHGNPVQYRNIWAVEK
jgi:hypothetical protein